MLNSRKFLSLFFFVNSLRETRRQANSCDSAGGGGKSKTRKNKIKEKNEKLTEERAKIAKENGKKKQPQNGKANEELSGIHPSRLNNMA
jgi:nucleolar protein 6